MPVKRVLAVDDDRRVLRILKQACESVGFEVFPVEDASFFPSVFDSFNPGVVFLDLNMREADGVELLRHIASSQPDTCVILASGVDERVITATYKLGCSLGLRMIDPIRKPLMIADIRQRLKIYSSGTTIRPDFCEPLPEAALRQALDEDRLVVCFQPVVNLLQGGVVGAEALARMLHPTQGMILPQRFIAQAEKHGLIEELTFAVLDKSLLQLRQWAGRDSTFGVAVNVSPLLLGNQELPDRVVSVLSRHEIEPQRLTLEVTESHGFEDHFSAAETLTRLRLKGVRLALDDFGTGYSSLGQLVQLPYETLKIDKSFAMQAEHSDEAAAVIRSSLEFARHVGLTVVAEGIQTRTMLDWLGELGCNFGQGFYISPPLHAEDFDHWLGRSGSVEFGPGLRAGEGPQPGDVARSDKMIAY